LAPLATAIHPSLHHPPQNKGETKKGYPIKDSLDIFAVEAVYKSFEAAIG